MKLIDPDALKEAFSFADTIEAHTAYLRLGVVLSTIDESPTIEAEPVRQGKWLPHPTERDYDVCSACGTGTLKRTHGYQDGGFWDAEEVYKYCPHCGAKMEYANA